MFGAFIAGAVLLTLVATAGLVVLFFWQKDKKDFGFQTIFTAYFYLMSVISLMAAFFGATYITKAVASDMFGRDFSYFNYAQVAPSPPMIKEEVSNIDSEQQQKIAIEQENQQIEAQYAEDLFNGISMMVVGILFLLVHVVGWRMLEPAKVRHHSVLFRAYIIVQLVIFSIATLVALPLALGNLLRYWLEAASNGSNLTPGEPISIALWSTPIWLFFVWLTIRTLRHQVAK